MENKKNVITDSLNYYNKYPSKIALDSPSGISYSYTDLYEISRTLDKKLSQVLANHSRIAIIMPMGIAYSLLTISLTRGHVVLPLNSNSSILEFKDFFKRFKINAIFIDKTIENGLIELAKKYNISVLQYENLKNNNLIFKVLYQGIKSLSEENKKINKDAVFILPTSGTTAKPKIVCLSNENVFYSAKNICKHLNLSGKDVCLNVMPLFHVHGLMVLVSSLFVGAEVVSTPKYNNQDFFLWLLKFKPTWYTASAGIQENILIKAQKQKDKLKNIKLRFIRSSSAPLSPQTTESLESVFNAPIAESYGMTEATLQITSQPLPPEAKKIGSCGKAAGVELSIINEKKEFLKNNEIGEIIIKGRSVINGYEDNDKENKKSFWKGWFCTGDLGYLDEDNFLFIKGRKKEMINKGGENISPREIDEALMGHKAVRLGVAFSMPHRTLGEDVAAAIVLESKYNLLEDELRNYLQDKLAKNKIPSKFYFVDNIPKTAVGKPQRVGLYAFLEEKAVVKKNNKAKTDLEKMLLSILEEKLNIKINVDDNYFEVGGDSILAMEIIQTLSEKGFNISFVDIQNYPTIKKLSTYIKENG
jgi:acyl-CoA synthetase (AMP-forming)/AMP-acid ligase II/acyl carrier protein